MSAMAASSDDKVVQNVLIMIAMEAEAEPLLKKLNLKQVPCNSATAPCVMYTGLYNGCTVSVVTNGKCQRHGVDNVGTVPAGIATFVAVEQFKPDLIINAGTAGGFKRKGATIGAAYLCSMMRHHDRRIPIPGFTEYGHGHHVGHPTPNALVALGLLSGIISTGNSLDCTETDDKLMNDHDATVKDMEAAAIAWTAELSGTPLIALKVVTDIVDGGRPTQEEFFENLGTAAASLQDKVPKLVDFVVGKKLNEL